MAQKPIAMEHLKQLLQLKSDGIGIREIARRLGISRNSVRKYLSKLPPTEALTEATLAQKAYSDATAHDVDRLQQLIIHFQYAGSELGKTGVTRQLLWQEYIDQHPDGYAYSPLLPPSEAIPKEQGSVDASGISGGRYDHDRFCRQKAVLCRYDDR